MTDETTYPASTEPAPVGEANPAPAPTPEPIPAETAAALTAAPAPADPFEARFTAAEARIAALEGAFNQTVAQVGQITGNAPKLQKFEGGLVAVEEIGAAVEPFIGFLAGLFHLHGSKVTAPPKG